VGLLTRNIDLVHEGHEIAIAMAFTGSSWSMATYKLYIDGDLADEQSVSALSGFLGGGVALRGKLPPNEHHAKPFSIRFVASMRVVRGNKYEVYVGGDQIHQEAGTWGGL